MGAQYPPRLLDDPPEPPILNPTTAQSPAPQDFNPGEGAAALFRRERKRRDKLMVANFRQSLGTDPTFVANMQRLAEQRGWKTEALEKLPPEKVKQLIAVQQFEFREMAKTSPILAAQLEDPEFARIAHDDLDNLSGIEAWYTEMGRSFEAGELLVDRGRIGDLWRQGELSDEQATRELAIIGRQLQYLPTSPSGFTTGFALTMGQMSKTMPAALTVGAASAGVGAGLGLIGGPLTPVTSTAGAAKGFLAGFTGMVVGQTAQIEAGNFYVDMLDAGYDRDTAARSAIGVGIFNGLVEGGLTVFGGQALTAPFRREIRRALLPGLGRALAQPGMASAMRQWGLNMALGTGGEITEEVLQEASNIVGEAVVRSNTLSIDRSARNVVGFDEFFRPIDRDPDEPLPEPINLEEIQERLVDVVVQTFYQTALLSGGTAGVAFWGDRMRAQQAEENYQALKKLAKLHQESTVAEHSPEKLAKMEEELAAQGVEMFFQGDDMMKVIAEQGITEGQLNALSPGLAEQFQTAAANQDLVQVNSLVFDKISRSEFVETLLPHIILIRPGDETYASREQGKRVRETETLMAEEYERRSSLDDQVKEEARQVQKEFEKELLAAGRPVENARADAKAYRNFATVMSAKFVVGERPMTPMEWHRSQGYAVAPEGATPETTPLRTREPAVATPQPLSAKGARKLVGRVEKNVQALEALPNEPTEEDIVAAQKPLREAIDTLASLQDFGGEQVDPLQVTGLQTRLRTEMRRTGLTSETVEVGAEFDPEFMESISGVPGVVQRVISPAVRDRSGKLVQTARVETGPASDIAVAPEGATPGTTPLRTAAAAEDPELFRQTDSPQLLDFGQAEDVAFGRRDLAPDARLVVAHKTSRRWIDQFLKEGIDTTEIPPDVNLGRLTGEERSRIEEAGLFVAPGHELGGDRRVVLDIPARDIALSPEAQGLGWKDAIKGLFGANDAIVVGKKISPENVIGAVDWVDGAWVWQPNPGHPASGQFTVNKAGFLQRVAPTGEDVLLEQADGKEVDHILDDDRIPVITLQDLVGETLFPTISDRTAAGRVFRGIDSSKLEIEIEMLGGPLFPLRQSNVGAGVVWANRGRGVTSQKGTRVKAGADHMLVVLGDADMHQSNNTVSNAFFATLEAYVRDKRITKANANKLTKLVKDAKTADKKVHAHLQKFPGFASIPKLDRYLHAISFQARKRLLTLLGSKAAEKLGAPPMKRILDSTREASMAGHRWGDGVMVVKIDPDKPFVELGEEGTQPHPDFPLGIRGEVVGKLREPLNYEVLWQDWMAATPRENPRRAFELSKPPVTITQELADTVGDTARGNIDGHRQAKLAVDMAVNRWRTSGQSVKAGGASPAGFVNAVTGSEAAAVLDEYTKPGVSKAVRSGDMRLFQLDEDSGIWFALKKGNPAEGYGIEVAGLNENDVTLTAVVNNEQGARGIAAPAVLLKALEEGATVLDAFAVRSPKFPGGFLPTLYKEFGFEVVAEIPFDRSFYSEQRLADAERFWRSTGWDLARDGYPPIAVMKWQGTDEQRAGLREAYLRHGTKGLVFGRDSGSVGSAVGELRESSRQEIEGRRGRADDRGAAGAEGTRPRRSVASRAFDVARDIGGLTDEAAANLGISIADRDAVRASVGTELFAASDQGRVRGQFRAADRMIFLTERQNATTIIHEFAHGFLTIYEDVLQQPVEQGNRAAELARQQMQEEFQRVLDFLEVTDMDSWLALSKEERKAKHEAWARTFERFWAEGRAPSQKMAKLFRKFQRWMADVYGDVIHTTNEIHKRQFGTDLPALTDEVRDVIGSLFASQEAVKQAAAARGLEDLFTEKPDAMSDADWQRLQTAYSERELLALEKHARDRLKNVAWVRTTTNTIDKVFDKAEDGLRDMVRRQVIENRSGEPVYRALNFVRTGELRDTEGVVTEEDVHKLRTADVKKLMPEVDLRKQMHGMTHPKGLHPDSVAKQFGYTDGRTMIDAMLMAKPFEEVVEEETNARLQAEHGEFADPKRRENLIDRALMNEAQARAVTIEYSLLAGLKQPVREMIIAARNVAKRLIEGRVVDKVRPRQFTIAAARAGREAQFRMMEGDFPAAAIAKRHQLLQEQMALEAIRVQEEIAKAKRDFKKFDKSDEKLAKSGRNVPLAMAARSVIQAYGLSRGGKRQQADIEELAAVDPLTYEIVKPMVDALNNNAKDWRKLTVGEFFEMHTGTMALWRNSDMAQHYGVGDGREKLVDVVSKSLAQLHKFGIPKAVEGRRPTKKETGRRDRRTVRAWLTHVESWAVKLDGGKPGVIHKYFFDRIRPFVDSYMIDKLQHEKELHDEIAKIEMATGAIAADPQTEFKHTFESMDELLGFLLHMGSLSNQRINLVGRGWAMDLENGQLDTRRVWRFIRRLVNDGVLSQEHFQLVQFVWDTYDSLKVRAKKASLDVQGFLFDEIDTEPFTIEFPGGESVTYRGGYAPARPDMDHEDNVSAPEQLTQTVDGLDTSVKSWQQGRRPSAEKGFMISRSGVTRPLEMSIARQTQHYDEELRFIHLQHAGRDIGRLFFHPEIRSAIEAIDPGAIKHMLLPWLDDTLHNRAVAPSGMPRKVDEFLKGIRRNTSTIFMFGNVANAAQQITGLATTVVLTGLKHVRMASGAYVANISGATQTAVKESKMMRLRIREQMGNISDDIERIFDPSWQGKWQNWTQEHKFFLQQWVQGPVDVISWHAGYNQAIEEGKTHKQAVRRADYVVRQSQSSGIAVDQSAFERGTPLWRLMTLFNTFWLKALNTVKMQPTPTAKMRAAAFILGWAGLLAGVISQLLRGGWEDDNEDGSTWDDFARWSMGEVGNTAVAVGAPVVGPMVARALFDNYSLGRLSPGATWSAAESALRVVSDLAIDPIQRTIEGEELKELKGRNWRDLGTLLTFFLKVPIATAGRPASYGFDVFVKETVEPKELFGVLPEEVDLIRGLVTGAASPGSRQ